MADNAVSKIGPKSAVLCAHVMLCFNGRHALNKLDVRVNATLFVYLS